MQTKLHLIMDMDGTICESRQDISPEMLSRLNALKLTNDIVVISGAEKERMLKQLKGLDVTIMAQSGNDTTLWKKLLTENEKKKILAHIGKVLDLRPAMIDDRGCQIALSFTGHDADINYKNKFDPSGIIRKTFLKENPFIHDKLECRIAGTTCLDYTRKDGTKGKNIQRFIKQMNWNKKDCIYFGDKLYKGGNDESVVGIIKVVSVVDPTDLLLKLKNYE